MRKTAVVLVLACGLFFTTYLQPVYRVTAGGERVPGLYSPAALREGINTARAAAEELSDSPAALPTIETRKLLRITPAQGLASTLSDALLRKTDTAVCADSVAVNGVPLGAVADGAALLESLRAEIRDGMPAGAAVGNLGGTLQIRPVYTRPDRVFSEADMLARISLLAPVFYLDSQGKVV